MVPGKGGLAVCDVASAVSGRNKLFADPVESFEDGDSALFGFSFCAYRSAKSCGAAAGDDNIVRHQKLLLRYLFRNSNAARVLFGVKGRAFCHSGGLDGAVVSW